MNSIVGPIFNEKVAEKWNLWVREQSLTVHGWLGQIVRLGKKKKKTENAAQDSTENAESKRALYLNNTPLKKKKNLKLKLKMFHLTNKEKGKNYS